MVVSSQPMVAGIRCDPSNSRDKIFCKMKLPKIHRLPINSSVKRGARKWPKGNRELRNGSEHPISEPFFVGGFEIGRASLGAGLHWRSGEGLRIKGVPFRRFMILCQHSKIIIF